jgi:hypothetical protein
MTVARLPTRGRTQEWNVYTHKIDGTAPVLVASKRRNALPELSRDASMLAMHNAGGGISLYRTGPNP